MVVPAQIPLHPLLGANLGDGRTLAIILWAGFAVLTVVFLLLTRTRWGQAKPLSKCIGLSVFVHILFLSYAYGTKLIFEFPEEPDEPVIGVRLLADTDERQQAPTTDQPLQPWEMAETEPPIASNWEAPDRQEPAMEPVEREASRADPPSLAEMPQSQWAPQAPPRPEADAPAPTVTSVTAPAAEAAVPELPVAQQQTQFPSPAPPVEQLTRAAEPPQPSPLPQRSTTDALPSELVEINSQLQRIEELPVESPRAEAVAADLDHPQKTEGSGSAFEHASSPPTTPGVAEDAARTPPATQPANDLPSGSVAPSGGTPAANLLASLPSVRRVADGQYVPEPLQLRMQPERSRAIAALGGNASTEEAVAAALSWLAAHQSPDGRWDASELEAGREVQINGHNRQGTGPDADTGITGLALLAFLGAGHTHLEGQYRRNVQYGLEFLLEVQKSDGNLAGDARLFASMYCHGMAALAISEAYALTGDQRLLPYVQRAIDYTVAAQNTTSGGWRYMPGDPGDMSQFGWQVMALKSAELAGISIPAYTHSGMQRFLRQASSGAYGGLASYRPGEATSHSMTAEALTCRAFLKTLNDASTVGEAADYLVQKLPGSGPTDLYYWYYGTLGLFHLQDSRWDRWNHALQAQLLASQRSGGDAAGSWDPDPTWGQYGGRVYSTALAALCLEVYYRYLPVLGGGK